MLYMVLRVSNKLIYLIFDNDEATLLAYIRPSVGWCDAELKPTTMLAQYSSANQNVHLEITKLANSFRRM